MRVIVRIDVGLILCVGLLAMMAGVSNGGSAGGASALTASYGSTPYQTVTVYRAKTNGSPLVILVHGGGWDSSTNVDYLPKEAADLQAAGFAVFDVNYDTMPRTYGAFPLEIDDVVDATIWAMAHATSYGASPTNVEMIGGSAGGQLVAMAAKDLNASHSGTVRAIVTLSGALDFVLKIARYRGRHREGLFRHSSPGGAGMLAEGRHVYRPP